MRYRELARQKNMPVIWTYVAYMGERGRCRRLGHANQHS